MKDNIIVEELDIVPYARLLTMLSEQLIKNEVVALTEIVKNSYDADAKWVKITFNNFSNNYKANKNSSIIIEDCGNGMTEEILKDDFINPASAIKKIRKDAGEKTDLGRVLQGEKGIGRFSLFKLGRKITVITKTTNDQLARKLIFDLSSYDKDFLQGDEQLKLNKIKPQYISKINYTFTEDIMLDGEYKKQLSKGTQITVECLNDSWGKAKVEKLKAELFTLLSNIYGEDFNIFFFLNNSFLPQESFTDKKLLDKIIQEKAVLRISGGYNEIQKEFYYSTNGKDIEVLSLSDKRITGLSIYRDYFIKEKEQGNFSDILTECGSFTFTFNVFDPDKANVREKYKMSDEEWPIVKENRVFLYRDNIRVFPYGSIKDDWLQVDTIRGTKKAGAMLSNDQLVGFIHISYAGNPKLSDKTNREGLIEEGNAYNDFIALNQTFLQFIKIYHYDPYKNKLKVIKKFDKQMQEDLNLEFNKLVESIQEPVLKHKAKNIQERVSEQNSYNISRIKVVEDLAGIGLSISATHHDLHNFIRRCYNIIDQLQTQMDLDLSIMISKEVIKERIERLRGIISSMESILRDMQALFSSSKQPAKNMRFSSVLDKVWGYYSNLFESKNIKFEVKNIGDSPLVIKIPEALILTILINIFDNTIYWLEDEGRKEKEVKITINSDESYVLFSDNGPGIFQEENEKIFEAFFTGKGIEGRGLGLYICRQFLDRYDYKISVDYKNENKLSGANFLIDFSKQGE